MFGLFTRPSHSRKPLVGRSTTLCLERLEDRLCPAFVTGESITLNVTYLQGKEATFSGHLQNQYGPMANQTVNLTGAVKASTSTDSQGNYSITLAVPQLGTEDAASADGLSDTALVAVQGGSPTISGFSAVYEGNGLWLFSGTVSGAPTQGAVVNFGGITPLQGQSTEVNSDGTFEFYAIVPANEGGQATAQVVDWWGDTSQVATAGVSY